VTDAETDLPIDAVVTFYKDSKPINSIITVNGKYTIPCQANDVFIVESKAFGYQTKTEEVTIPVTTLNLVNYDIKLQKMAVGQVIKLENILFELASDNLLPESFPELDKLLRFLKASPSVDIEIAGHTSSEGNDNYNLKLSQDRAKSIANYLISKGISSSRII
jgi:outer membrane protein OmpA-like peptidoglycan-associated protein